MSFIIVEWKPRVVDEFGDEEDVMSFIRCVFNSEDDLVHSEFETWDEAEEEIAEDPPGPGMLAAIVDTKHPPKHYKPRKTWNPGSDWMARNTIFEIPSDLSMWYYQGNKRCRVPVTFFMVARPKLEATKMLWRMMLAAGFELR